MIGNFGGWPVQAWRFAVAFLADRQRSRAAAREIASFGPDEGAHLLGDFGLTLTEFNEMMQSSFASEDLLSSAMRLLGVDPFEVRASHGARNRAMQIACMACPHRRRCRREIATASFVGRYRDFCPNSEDLDELVEGRKANGYAASAETCIA
jgi:hypothetical protein